MESHHENEQEVHGTEHWFKFGALPTPLQKFLQSIDDGIEVVYNVRARGTTIQREMYLGIVQFISCLYILPVVPEQLARAGYDRGSTIVSTAVVCCIGCIVGSILTNMPFIIAPPTSVSIFLAVYLQQQGLPTHVGNLAVIISGIGLLAIGIYRPLGTLITRVKLT